MVHFEVRVSCFDDTSWLGRALHLHGVLRTERRHRGTGWRSTAQVGLLLYIGSFLESIQTCNTFGILMTRMT